MQEALKVCESAIEKKISASHKGAGWIFFKGLLYVQNGNMEDGMTYLNRGLEIDPTHEAGLQAKLGLMALKGNTPREWLEPLDNALKVDDSLWNVHCLKAYKTFFESHLTISLPSFLLLHLFCYLFPVIFCNVSNLFFKEWHTSS